MIAVRVRTIRIGGRDWTQLWTEQGQVGLSGQQADGESLKGTWLRYKVRGRGGKSDIEAGSSWQTALAGQGQDGGRNLVKKTAQRRPIKVWSKGEFLPIYIVLITIVSSIRM